MSKKSADFGKWLTRKFLDIQSESGRQWTITEFAEFLNSPQQSVSRWLAGGLPEEARIDKLASILGDEIYEAANLPRPSISRRVLDKLSEGVKNVPPDYQQEALDFVTNATAEEWVYFITATIAAIRKREKRGSDGNGPGPGELSHESRGETRRKKARQRSDRGIA